jgi:hypothetical protein
MAYRYHPEIEGLKLNEDGSEILLNGESLLVGKLKRTSRNSDMLYVYFRNRTYSVAKLVCECWNGMSDNPRWYATRKEKTKGFHYTNLFWAPCGTNPNARNSKRSNTSKVTEVAVKIIEQRLKNGETLKAIARDYNTSDMSISRIKKQMNKK